MHSAFLPFCVHMGFEQMPPLAKTRDLDKVQGGSVCRVYFVKGNATVSPWFKIT